MIKQLLVIRDPEDEVGFDVLVKYCEIVQNIVGNEDIQVLPIWPHGEVELINNNEGAKLKIAQIKDVIKEFEVHLDVNDEKGGEKDE